jgi:Ribonuclease G/E
VWDAFQKALSKDRARTNVTKISELGLVEMTRKRTRESLVQLLTEPCQTCEGAGVVKSVTTVAYEILREVRRNGMLVDNEKIEIEAAPRVAEVLQRQEREYLDSLEKRFQKLITVIGQKGWKPDQYRVAGKMSSEIAAQAAAEAPAHHVHHKNGSTQGGGGGGPSGSGRRRRRRGGRGRDRAEA